MAGRFENFWFAYQELAVSYKLRLTFCLILISISFLASRKLFMLNFFFGTVGFVVLSFCKVYCIFWWVWKITTEYCLVTNCMCSWRTIFPLHKWIYFYAIHWKDCALSLIEHIPMSWKGVMSTSGVYSEIFVAWRTWRC